MSEKHIAPVSEHQCNCTGVGVSQLPNRVESTNGSIRFIIRNLDDTTTMMSSIDYKMRFIAEYAQLKLRYLKLQKTNAKIEAGTLHFKTDCSEELLRKQQSLMGQLLNIMEVRAKIEKIDLPIVYI